MSAARTPNAREIASQHPEFGIQPLLHRRFVEFDADARRIRNRQEAFGIQLHRFAQIGVVLVLIVGEFLHREIEGMEIWRTRDRMVMIATVADDYPRARNIPPQYDEWEALMWTFQKALPHTAPGQKWLPMTQIFDLARQKGVTAMAD